MPSKCSLFGRNSLETDTCSAIVQQKRLKAGTQKKNSGVSPFSVVGNAYAISLETRGMETEKY